MCLSGSLPRDEMAYSALWETRKPCSSMLARRALWRRLGRRSGQTDLSRQRRRCDAPARASLPPAERARARRDANRRLIRVTCVIARVRSAAATSTARRACNRQRADSHSTAPANRRAITVYSAHTATDAPCRPAHHADTSADAAGIGRRDTLSRRGGTIDGACSRRGPSHTGARCWRS